MRRMVVEDPGLALSDSSKSTGHLGKSVDNFDYFCCHLTIFWAQILIKTQFNSILAIANFGNEKRMVLLLSDSVSLAE